MSRKITKSKTWRDNKYKSKCKYYSKHSKNRHNGYNKWSMSECELLLAHEISDVKLSRILNRTLIALHVKRARLVKKLEEVIIP